MSAHLARGNPWTAAPKAGAGHEALAAQDRLAGEKWQRVRLRRGAKSPLRATFAAVRERAVDDFARAPGSGRTGMVQERRRFWLLGERRSTDESEYRPLQSAGRDRAGEARRHPQGALAVRAGSSAAQGGAWLDHFEGRSWIGLQRHTLSMIAFSPAPPAPGGARWGRKTIGPLPRPSLPAIPTAIPALVDAPVRKMSHPTAPHLLHPHLNLPK
jgi:hypothetical protein